MKYALTEVQVTDPRPVHIAADEDGAGILVRDGEVPIAFFMVESPATTIDGEELHRLLMTAAGSDIMRAAIRRELSPAPSDAPAPQLTVAVCTRDHPDRVARVIASLQTAAAGIDLDHALDILIVDNAPSDQRTRQVVESFPRVRYVCEVKPGLNFARNVAIQHASGEWLAYVDDDAVVDRYWLAALTSAVRQNPEAGAFTGPVLPYELSTTAQILFERRGGFGRTFTWQRYSADSAHEPNYPCNAGMFGTGCNMTFRRSLLVAVGGFDEALDTGAPLPGGGDLDMFYRILRSGAPLVYEPRLVVFHQHRLEYTELKHQMYTWGLGTMAYVAKHYRSDLPMRPRFRCMMLGFYRRIGSSVIQNLGNRGNWTAGLALAELWGGIVGICGEYGRSQRRIERIRRQFT